MRPNFTPTQREWLRSYLPEYIAHVHRQSGASNITSGHQFALKVAREFLQTWPPPLENRPEVTKEEDICDKVHEWFKNNNKTPRNMPMLKTRSDPAQSAQQLYATNDENFKSAFKKKIQDQPTSQNLPIFNRLKTEMWEKLSPEEQIPWVERAAELRDNKKNGVSETEKQSNRSLLEASFTQILQNYVAKTGYSFYVFGAGPPDVSGEEPPTFRMEMCSVEGLSFRKFHPMFHAHVVQPWLDYADYIEEQRILKDRLHNLITTDTDGFPILPAKGPSWSVSEGSAVLTAYLDQLWYKLHDSVTKHLQVPWSKLERDPAQFLNIDDLPASCKEFRKPSKFDNADSIIDLYRFCMTRMEMEPVNRFPFILQPSPSTKQHPHLTPTQRKRQELITLRESEMDARASPLSSLPPDDEDDSTFLDELETEHLHDIQQADSNTGADSAEMPQDSTMSVSPVSTLKANFAQYFSSHSDTESQPASLEVQDDTHSQNQDNRTSRKRAHSTPDEDLQTSTTGQEHSHAKRGRRPGRNGSAKNRGKKQTNSVTKEQVARRSIRQKGNPSETQPSTITKPKSSIINRVPVAQRYMMVPRE